MTLTLNMSLEVLILLGTTYIYYIVRIVILVTGELYHTGKKAKEALKKYEVHYHRIFTGGSNFRIDSTFSHSYTPSSVELLKIHHNLPCCT